jgi:hypothetical protein
VRRIYAALLRFDGDVGAALAPARAYARHWVSQPWGGWPAGHAATEGSFTADDDSIVRWRTLEGDTARLWELQVDERFRDDPSMRQSTLLHIGGSGDEAFAFVQVSMRSTDGALTGGVVYENDPPGVVALLVDKVPCRDGDRPLSTAAWSVTRAAEPEFRRLLESPKRRLPTVLFVADAMFGDDKAGEVAAALAGLAHVAVVRREQLEALTERTGLDIPPGANAYLWWASLGNGLRRPQSFRGDALAPSQWGTPAWPVVRTVFSVAAFRLDPPALASQLEAESTLRRIRAVEASAKSTEADSELLQAWEADLVQLERAQRQTAYLELENDRLQNDLNALLAAFDITVAEATRTRDASDTSEGDQPATLADAIAAAQKQCEALVFLPEALRSAEAWRYQRPDVVLAALLTLDELAQAWRRGDLNGPFLIAARAAGLPWRPAISQTAQTQFRDDYLRRYGDEDVLLGPHLAWGNSPDNALRIYLYLDRQTRTIVVGHAGRHLRDTSNTHL